MTDPIEREFRLFHARNPRVYREIVRMAYDDQRSQLIAQHVARKKGMRVPKVRGSMAAIFEDLRAQGYVLDNDFRSRYARLVMEREPDLKGFFVIRGLRSHLVKEAA